MASLPSATTRVQDASGGLATGTDLICVFAPVPTPGLALPILYSSTQDILDGHGYAPAVDFAALHIEATGKPVLFVPMPIVTPGTVGRVNTAGNTGTCVVSVAAGASGSLDEVAGILSVTTGGTIGVNGIVLSLSLDGGRNTKPVRLGTANSYTIPYVGQVLSFAAGTLVAGDTVITWTSTAPLADSTGIAAAKTALVAQQKSARTWLLIGDVSATAGAMTAIKTAVDAYETANERYVTAKVSLRDRLPLAAMSQTTVRKTGSSTLTFAEVGATGDTITRSAGSWIADGFVNGDRITVTGSVSNNITDAKVTTVSALVLTLDTTDLAAEGPVADVVVTGTPAIIFAEVGATGDTITRTRGSWLADGFRAGDILTIDGTASNDGTLLVGLVTVTATVITLDTDDLVAEEIGQNLITITAGETDAVAVAALDATFATITSDRRVDLGYGRGAMVSPIHGWALRRSVQWADAILSYRHDIRTTTWWKDLGPISSRIPAGFDLEDAAGNPYEHDERVTGGALAARFTCARTWGNGPVGAFIAQSLTRADDGSILGMTHNGYVTDLAQTIVQRTTENFAGATLVLEPADQAGKRVATAQSLKQFEDKVDAELQRYLLSNIGGEGPRASVAAWTAATDDDLGVADAILHGSLELELNGTIVHISTVMTVK